MTGLGWRPPLMTMQLVVSVCAERLGGVAIFAAIALAAATIPRGPASAQDAPPEGEPTTATEAALQEKYGDKISFEDYTTYRDLVDALPDPEKAWELTLEDQLGSFYFPIHLRKRITPNYVPENSEWGFIADDPALPRVILIGDSISRSYTVGVRKALAGKANVHRAPANCGPTDSGLKNMDVWLDQGSGEWDIIYFNFGIHDRRKSPEQYQANLGKVVARLQETGAQLIFGRTTPFEEKDVPGVDGSIALNAVSDAVMEQNDIPVDDLHAAVADDLDTVQAEDRTHFNGDGIRLLADQVATCVAGQIGVVNE